MNILDRRKEKSEAILKDQFIRQQLTEESKEIDQAQESLMARRGFTSSYTRNFVVNNNRLDYDHSPSLRFADMKYITGKNKGRFKKKNHPVHNKILFGHANNIIRRLQFGFTEAVREQLSGDLPNI